MSRDLFDFWRRLRRGRTVHPEDEAAFKRVDAKKHGFRLDCLPGNFGGRLRTADVVLLYLSPGFSETDVADATDQKFIRYHFKKLRGDEPFSNDPNRPGFKWLESRTRVFGDFETVRHRLAVLNIGAYHSRSVADYALLTALPSSRVAVDWAQEKLFPEAEKGKRIVICMRAASHWGLEVGRRYSGTLFAPFVNRGGYLLKNRANERLMKVVRERLS
jgi:hypothetical protein